MPWNERLKDKLQRCMESGLVKHYIRRYIPSKYLDGADGPSADASVVKPFTLQHFVAAFCILSAGIVFAVLAHAWENYTAQS